MVLTGEQRRKKAQRELEKSQEQNLIRVKIKSGVKVSNKVTPLNKFEMPPNDPYAI